MDFTLSKYEALLKAFQRGGYECFSFERFLEAPATAKAFILRHDVDLFPLNSLRTAEIEHSLGLRGVYYFRIVKESNQPDVIKKIADLGHEIGYHYEDVTIAAKTLKTKGISESDTASFEKELYQLAISNFTKHLEYFRQYYPVKTVCMHGSPLSKWDSRNLWKFFDYKDFGIIGEPYFDLDFTKMLYLTDTGRRWDGHQVSVRDKEFKTSQALLSDYYRFHSTNNIMAAINAGSLPELVMINTHPQRWTNNKLLWTKEFVLQNVKNPIKQILIRNRG